MKAIVTMMLLVWLAIVLILAAGGAFVSPIGTPPLRIVAAVAVPLLVFFGLYTTSAAFRDFVLGSDLSLITAIQAWRFAGFAFVALQVHGVLPRVFSWPAGLGDMAIGITAPFVAAALIRRTDFAASRTFVIWNLLGILDLVLAVSIAAVSASLATGAASQITVAPMAQLPLALVPVFLVPFFVMLHLAALIQVRRVAFSDRPSRGKERLSRPVASVARF
jgi:hypothetical protein